MKYLMLDKNDITKACGTITSQELKRELGLTSAQLHNFVDRGRVLRDRYILIEVDENKQEEEYSKLIMETEGMRRYYATNKGRIYVVFKSGKTRELSGMVSKGVLVTKIGGREYTTKNLVASLFIDDYKNGDVVMLKDDRNPRNISVSNLICISKEKYARMTGPLSRSRRVGLFEGGKCIRTFRSAREAGRKLYCSYQTISDICNNKYKKKLFDVRWL